jgi:hypothetical protein
VATCCTAAVSVWRIAAVAETVTDSSMEPIRSFASTRTSRFVTVILAAVNVWNPVTLTTTV